MRFVFSIDISNNWSLRQLDVNNAFFQGNLLEIVYMTQPLGFIDFDHPTHVCKLHKTIYGLKQAPWEWYHELRQFLVDSKFKNSYSETFLFVLNIGPKLIYLLVYVDDIIITSNSEDLVSQVVDCLAHHFFLKDLGTLSIFLALKLFLIDMVSYFPNGAISRICLLRLIWKMLNMSLLFYQPIHQHLRYHRGHLPLIHLNTEQ